MYIQGDIPFEAGRFSSTEGRDDTEAENVVFPVMPAPRNCNKTQLKLS